MGDTNSQTPEQQRQRRKRINRIKNGIIITISSWMLASFIAIIVLIVWLVNLNHKVDQNGTVAVNSTDTEEEETGSTARIDYDQIVTGIDTDDNMAVEGDTHYVYLTFDGGPSSNTEAILDALAAYNIKATFFVIGDESEEAAAIYQRIVNEGHTLGMHSYSNQYSQIYASTDAFYNDLYLLSDYLYEVTGVRSTYYRFPGGSSNEISNLNMADFVNVLNKEGIVYYDWNVSAGDASSSYTVDDVISHVTTGVSKYKTSVVLLHDADNKSTTVEAIGPLIESLQSMGAVILPIDEDTSVIQYIKADSVVEY